MFVKKYQTRADPFAHLLDGGEENDDNRQSRFLHKVVSSETSEGGVPSSDEPMDYVSPFRDSNAVSSAQRRRLARYPTTSATSAFTLANPAELGYKNISPSTKRAKDIQFPLYLQNNERRQDKLLRELESKEAHLRYLEDSQVIYDYTKEGQEAKRKQEEEESEDEEEEEEEGVEETPVVEEASEQGEENLETEDPEIEVTEVQKVETVPEVVTTPSKVEEPQEIQEEVTAPPEVKAIEDIKEPEEQKPEEKLLEDEKPEEKLLEMPKPEEKLEEPLDPSKAPRVVLPTDHDKSFVGKFSLFKTHTVVAPNPAATPENPEEIVKTDKEGFLSKAVYDKVQYRTAVHKNWISDFTKTEQKKYDEKSIEYKDRLAKLQSEIVEIETAMDQLREDTNKKIDISENELTRRLLKRTQAHVQKKNKIFKETEFIKNQKLEETQNVIGKQTEVQKEIDELNTQKEAVEKEHIQWSTRLAELSADVDAKVSNLKSISEKQKGIQDEIAELKLSKEDLEKQTEENNQKHLDNIKVLENVANKEYLPRILEIDGQITTLMGQLTVVKHESANERTQLAAVTKKIQEESRAREQKLKAEAEERKRQEENLLVKQREELEAKAEEAKLHHDEELRKLKEEYVALETKLKEEQQQREAIEREQIAKAQKNEPGTAENEFDSKNRSKAEAAHAAKLAIDSRKIQNPSRDSSLYEYETEEEIMSG